MCQGCVVVDKKSAGAEGWNYRVMLIQGISSSTSNHLLNPLLVIPFLAQTAGVPTVITGLLYPLVQSMRFVAEIMVAPFLDGTQAAKWFSMSAWLGIAFAMAVVAIALDDLPVIGLVILFVVSSTMIGVCRGVNNIGFGQVLGAAIPPERRSSLMFAGVALAGFVVIGTAWLTRVWLANDPSVERHITVLWFGVITAVVSGLLFVAIQILEEVEDNKKGAKRPNASRSVVRHFVDSARKGYDFARQLEWYRRFLLARVLFLSIEIAMPFYIIHAVTFQQHVKGGLTIFVVAAGLGMVLGSVVWGMVARRSIKLVMFATCILGCAAPLLALGLDTFDKSHHPALYGIVIFSLSFSANGLSQARYLYQVNMSAHGDRPYLTAFADVVTVGLGIFLAAGLGVLAHLHNVTVPLMVLFMLSVAAGIWALRLVETGPQAPEALAAMPHAVHHA